MKERRLKRISKLKKTIEIQSYIITGLTFLQVLSWAWRRRK